MPLRNSFALLLFAITVEASAVAQTNAPPDTIMCNPGELVFSETFHPETVSERWGFKADFALREGGLLRTKVDPTESKRVFLKDVSIGDAIIQFDFKLSGATTDLRLVTGSGGGYNSVTQISRDHFQVNTPVDRNAGFAPAQLGECSRIKRDRGWQTMTVEYWNDEIAAHLSDKEYVLGQHPIIDRTRTYFAFQFDLPGASIDNIRIWNASGKRDDWKETRERLGSAQESRPPVKRDPAARYKIEYIKLKSRLTLHDHHYRDLVAKHHQLKAALHADFPKAFASHKQLSKLIAKRKKNLKEGDSKFRQMESAVNKASRAEDTYVLSKMPELEKLKANSVPRQRYVSELGQVRARLESVADQRLIELVAETAKLQTDLESRFPKAFESVDDAVANRNAERKSLNNDADFQNRNRAVVDAGKAIKDYENQAAPDLEKLAANAKAYLILRNSSDHR